VPNVAQVLAQQYQALYGHIPGIADQIIQRNMPNHMEGGLVLNAGYDPAVEWTPQNGYVPDALQTVGDWMHTGNIIDAFRNADRIAQPWRFAEEALHTYEHHVDLGDYQYLSKQRAMPSPDKVRQALNFIRKSAGRAVKGVQAVGRILHGMTPSERMRRALELVHKHERKAAAKAFPPANPFSGSHTTQKVVEWADPPVQNVVGSVLAEVVDTEQRAHDIAEAFQELADNMRKTREEQAKANSPITKLAAGKVRLPKRPSTQTNPSEAINPRRGTDPFNEFGERP
jgi:hypothetical protein